MTQQKTKQFFQTKKNKGGTFCPALINTKKNQIIMKTNNKDLKEEILKLVQWKIDAKKRLQNEINSEVKNKRHTAINSVQKTIETLYGAYCILYNRNEFNFNKFESIGQYYFLKK